MKLIVTFLTALLMLPVSATATVARAAEGQDAISAVNDVIARVGDQPITFSEISTAINSSAIVGVSIPALGTPQRDSVRIIMLDRFISINLLYLDALKQGVDKDPSYQRPVNRFSDAILAGLYWQRNQTGEIAVTEKEIQDYFKQNVVPGKELNEDARVQIEAALRRQKLHEQMAKADKTLRDDVTVVVHEENLDIKDDEQRADDAPLAEVGTETITWGEISDKIIAAGKGALIVDSQASESQARRDALEHEIDMQILVQKARAAGLDKDPLYLQRMNEYGKMLLINQHRERLVKTMDPSLQELKAYYEANRNRFVVPEARKLQMVVVKTEEEARRIKDRIEAGETTLYVAARDHSLAVNAKKDLGEVGWVNQGDMAATLDEVIFSLAPGELGGPVESPAGWHLVKVQEMREAKYTDFDDETTRKLARRRYLHDKLDAYTVELREKQFPVKVYQERLVQLEQREADMVKSLMEKAQQPGSVTQQRVEELQGMMKKPSKEPSM
jgi:parvulin-like peptidyl-prolyl isomerase